MTYSQDRGEFERLAPVIARALPYALHTHTLDDVWRAIELGEVQFWPGERSAIITEVQQAPRCRMVHFFLAAGEMAEIERMVPRIEEWARQIGASRMTLAGRKGWQRSFLAGRGYTPQWIVMAKELDHE